MKALGRWARLIFIFGFLLSLSGHVYFFNDWYARSYVGRVVDGDSFDLADGRRTRLLSIDSPEKDRCMASESRLMLEDLVLHKHVSLSEIVTDDFGRILAVVQEGSTSINQLMIASGMARFTHVKNTHYEAMTQAHTIAREEKKGIYSPLCLNTLPTTDCVIKGNLRSGEKVYHLPPCKNYAQTAIDEAYGDAWFCTEDEAVAAGFRKAAGCDGE